jgi:DNA-binding phage protein
MMGSNRQTGSGMMSGNAQNGSGWEWMDTMHEWMTTSVGMHTFVWNILAEKFGLTSIELYGQVNNGKTITQIAEEKGVSRADLIAALETAHQNSLAQAVTDGTLTQEQADSILAQMAGRYEWMLDNMGNGNMMGGQYGTGGCHGNWNGSPTNQQPKP